MAAIRLLLYPFALLYGAVMWLRNRLYDSGFFASITFDIPVISVGNLSVGGTGKTPHVEYLAQLLRSRFNVATMSRGYKRRTQGFIIAGDGSDAMQIGDEPMQYHLKFPDVTVSVAEERLTGIPWLLQQRPETDVILLDDAYQHRSVRAGLNILVTDYSRPFYRDHVLPYGRLRESRKAYKRADMIIVSKCPPSLQEAQATAIMQQISPLPGQEVFFSTIRYQPAYDLFTQAPVSLAGKHILLVCCIARPASLISAVEGMAAGVHVLSYPDHHYFRDRDIEEIQAAFTNQPEAGTLILTTEKDATRLHLHADRLRELQLPIAVLPVTVGILFGKEDAFNQKIETYTRQALAAYRSVPEETA